MRLRMAKAELATLPTSTSLSEAAAEALLSGYPKSAARLYRMASLVERSPEDARGLELIAHEILMGLMDPDKVTVH